MMELNFNIYTYKGQDGDFFKARAELPETQQNSKVFNICQKLIEGLIIRAWECNSLSAYFIIEDNFHIDFDINSPFYFSLDDIKNGLTAVLYETGAELGNIEFYKKNGKVKEKV